MEGNKLIEIFVRSNYEKCGVEREEWFYFRVIIRRSWIVFKDKEGDRGEGRRRRKEFVKGKIGESDMVEVYIYGEGVRKGEGDGWVRILKMWKGGMVFNFFKF